MKEWTGETNEEQGFWNKKRFVVSWENTEVKVVDVLTLEEDNFDIRIIGKDCGLDEQNSDGFETL